MSPRNTNVPPQQQNAKNTQKDQATAENRVQKALTEFMEKRLGGANGGKELQAIMKSGCKWLKRLFLQHVDSDRAYEWRSDIEVQTFNNVSDRSFFREAVRIGTIFKSKQGTVEHILERAFDLTLLVKKDRNYLSGKILELSLDDLDWIIGSQLERERWLKGMPNLQLVRRDISQEISRIFDRITLSPAQVETARKLITQPYVTEEDIGDALALFPNLASKQLLIKAFLPTISLGDLKRMKVLNKTQVRTAIEETLRKSDLGKIFGSKLSADEVQTVVDNMDADEIMVDTMLFPADIVDTILHGTGRKAIADELNKQKKEYDRALMDENSLSLKPDANGKYYDAFIGHLRWAQIRDAEKFTKDALVRGTIKDKEGKDLHFVWRIDDIVDTPAENERHHGNGRVVSVSNVLLADGSLHLRAPRSASPEYTYHEISHILQACQRQKTLEIFNQDDLRRNLENGKTKETLKENDIQTIADLNAAIDADDRAGSRFPLTETGRVSFTVGEMGKDDYWMHEVLSVNPATKTVNVTNGQTNETLSFTAFAAAFKQFGSKRTTSITNKEEWLGQMQTTGKESGEFSKLSFKDGKLVPDNRKDDAEFAGVTEFVGKSNLIQIKDISGNRAEYVIYENYDEKKPLEEQSASAFNYATSFAALFSHMGRDASKPKIPEKNQKPPEKKDAHVHWHSGWLKSYIGNPSLHDIIHGANDLVKFFKNHLEHGSHLQSANVQLALAKKLKWLGVNEGLITELRAKVYSGNKKLMTEIIDTLKGLPSPERHEEVEHILITKGSHDYEIQACVIAMLHKHGNLYAGTMKKYQGSFLYFERLSGCEYSPDLVIKDGNSEFPVAKWIGSPPREEHLIQMYLKWLGSKDGGYKVDGNFWLEVKKGWVSGINDESTTGKNETARNYTVEGRVNYAVDKFKSAEYAHGIGGLDSVWTGGGPAHLMHLGGATLALSNIPMHLHQEQIRTVTNKFGAGHPYVAHLFLSTPEDQAVFRHVIKRLCASDAKASTAYSIIEKLQKEDAKGELPEKVIAFWKDHGAKLHKKLLGIDDGTIFLLAQQWDTIVKEYLKKAEGSFAEMEIDKDELSNTAYSHEKNSHFAINPEAYISMIRVNPAQAILEQDPKSEMFWKGMVAGIEAVKSMKTGTPEENRKVQEAQYARYHKALFGFFKGRFKKQVYNSDLKDQEYIASLEKQFGMRLPSYDLSLDSEEYKQNVAQDFEEYLRGGRNVQTETINVAEGVNSLLGASEYHRPPHQRNASANDPRMRRSA